jgi:hypothetical protein
MTSTDPRPDRQSETQKGQNRKRSAQKEQTMTSARDAAAKPDQSSGRFYSFTIDANTAQIVKLESLDASGARRELSEEEKAKLVKEVRDDLLEKVVERAFEAGIACVLDTGVEALDAKDSREDAELRHLLLVPLIERSAAKHFLEREVLNRAILDTLIDHSINPTSSGFEESSTASAQ